MKIVTANRLADGRVIYLAADGAPVDRLDAAGRFDDAAAEAALARAARQPAVFVNPYLVEVEAGRPSGRDRFRETIRARGPTVGHSLGHA
ncbi:MAG: DUF2849 domain-containing protein [Hydrogenophaga sp.]|uniref:DUF2849 domain-containing protein n=1 Tax=Hydrogenophaga sp. TaxID=1904254 RepID=UPI0025C53232|nr:DUF2849 domain-containing protein [Hydrogenophaga sp.]MBU7572923.1 DUF2849 domain-containing protein [Hydrogenophaga sp.]